ncbi:hypothetical protein BU25DRAFT_420250 [Macroventuria anomochaeta]|uniref:Uncharacterized protein n=1 Tax=Macroventuria anomochaeta TaxID=301207 RepID=A0ACB6S5E5_9PLEO|nr:uncharacterized protein BU25DRAFT_420250 [Macroventuria anomochaeta]KAF2629401.1 hypothetical protein BU25DRAFT_420250 [Macroventuria anomochaeta]
MRSLAAGMVVTGVPLELNTPATRVADNSCGLQSRKSESRFLTSCGCNPGEPVRQRRTPALRTRLCPEANEALRCIPSAKNHVAARCRSAATWTPQSNVEEASFQDYQSQGNASDALRHSVSCIISVVIGMMKEKSATCSKIAVMIQLPAVLSFRPDPGKQNDTIGITTAQRRLRPSNGRGSQRTILNRDACGLK